MVFPFPRGPDNHNILVPFINTPSDCLCEVVGLLVGIPEEPAGIFPGNFVVDGVQVAHYRFSFQSGTVKVHYAAVAADYMFSLPEVCKRYRMHGKIPVSEYYSSRDIKNDVLIHQCRQLLKNIKI